MLLSERERRLQVPQVSFADTWGGSLFLLDANCSSPDGLHGLHGGNGLFTSGQWWNSQPSTSPPPTLAGRGMAPYFRKVHVKVWPHLYHKRDGGLITGQIPTWPFLGKSESHRYFFCRVWMEYNTYYVKVSCLFQLLPSWSSGFVCLFVFGVLGADRAFICLWPSAFPGCQLLHFRASDTWGKKKSQGAHHYIISRFPRCLTSLPSSAHPSVFLCLS